MMYQIDDHPFGSQVGARHLASVEVRWNLPCQRSIASDGDPWTGESERRAAPLRSDDGIHHIVWLGLRTSVYLACTACLLWARETAVYN